MISDQIGDLLTRVRNATRVQKEETSASFSKTNWNILKVIKATGYINGFEKVAQDFENKKFLLKISLKYKNNISVIQGIRRISKPGLRIYSKSKNLPRVLNGIGTAIVSTSKGIMTSEEAKKIQLGGEVLAYIW